LQYFIFRITPYAGSLSFSLSLLNISFPPRFRLFCHFFFPQAKEFLDFHNEFVKTTKNNKKIAPITMTTNAPSSFTNVSMTAFPFVQSFPLFSLSFLSFSL